MIWKLQEVRLNKQELMSQYTYDNRPVADQSAWNLQTTKTLRSSRVNPTELKVRFTSVADQGDRSNSRQIDDQGGLERK